MRRFFAGLFLFTSLLAFGQEHSWQDVWQIYQAGNYGRVVEVVYPLWKSDSTNIELNLLMGSSYAYGGSYTTAMPFLDYCARTDTSHSWLKARALDDLGTCCFMLQDVDRSKKELLDCIQLQATKNITQDAYAKTLLFGFDEYYQTWKTVRSDHFIFHFQDMEEGNRTRFVTMHEVAFRKIQAFFNSSLPKKIDLFVWNSADDARKVLGVTLGFSKSEFCVVHALSKQTIGHEMTHVISNYMAKNMKKTRFINEGTAVYFDQTVRDREKQVKDFLQANPAKISIKDLWLNHQTCQDELLYPLSALVVGKLIDRFGKDKFLLFFRDQTYDNARNVFGDQLDGLIRDIENSVNPS